MKKELALEDLREGAAALPNPAAPTEPGVPVRVVVSGVFCDFGGVALPLALWVNVVRVGD